MNSCAASLQLDDGDFLGRLAGFLIGVGEGHGYGADPDESQYKISHTFARIPDVAGTHPTSGRQSTARFRFCLLAVRILFYECAMYDITLCNQHVSMSEFLGN